MQLLGTTMSLVGLRHELSFALKIDDPAFASKMTGNYESKAAIHMVDIENLQDAAFWKNDDLDKLNCTSASLFELIRESSIYKECLDSSNAISKQVEERTE